jgi:hypothetical protein
VPVRGKGSIKESMQSERNLGSKSQKNQTWHGPTAPCIQVGKRKGNHAVAKELKISTSRGVQFSAVPAGWAHLVNGFFDQIRIFKTNERDTCGVVMILKAD